MNKTEQVKLNEIAKLFRDYYKKHLDDEYLFKTIAPIGRFIEIRLEGWKKKGWKGGWMI